MAKTTYNSSSPYFNTPQTSWFLGPLKPRNVPESASDTLITVDAKYQFRPDLLSYDLYGTPSFWWVFMMRNMNDIRDPIWDLKAGMQIYAPSASRLTSLLA